MECKELDTIWQLNNGNANNTLRRKQVSLKNIKHLTAVGVVPAAKSLLFKPKVGERES